MEVGQSFFVEKGRFKTNSLMQLKSLIYRKSVEYKIETGDLARFTSSIDRLKNGIRCWRIE
jgi:hypothetical protein